VSGVHSGVLAPAKEMQPRAIFLHYASHNLNLVLHARIKAIPHISNFYSLLQRVFTFFGNRLKDENCSQKKEQLAPYLKAVSCKVA
jgi:hypothetical protein